MIRHSVPQFNQPEPDCEGCCSTRATVQEQYLIDGDPIERRQRKHKKNAVKPMPHREASNHEAEYELVPIKGRSWLTQPTCEIIHSDEETTEPGLELVAHCLAHLFQGLDEKHESESYTRGDTNHYSHRYQIPNLPERRSTSGRDQMRLKKIVDIHAILLRALPLEAKVNDSNCIKNVLLKGDKSLNRARMRVLNLIETLNGYCDSINLLRCTLRSSHIVQAILAFDEIIQKVGLELQRANEFAAKKSLIRDVSGSEIPKVEFRIVREWTV